MILNSHDLKLEDRHLLLVPRAVRARRTQPPVRVPYRDIVDIAIVEPADGERRTLSLRLVDGTTVATPFSDRSTLKMRSIQHQVRKRVRAARPPARD